MAITKVNTVSALVCSVAPWGGYNFGAQGIITHQLMSAVVGGTRNMDVVVRLEIASAGRCRFSAFVNALHEGCKEDI